MQAETAKMRGVLEGVRVLEIGHFVAAPFCTRLLADLGADVIKVEPPQGDPVRRWGEMVEGNSLWWSMHGRNKRSIAIDIKSEAGRDIVRRLAAECDVVVENFRPGQLEKLGLGADVLRKARPGLIVAHISGYGQDGPYRNRAAFGMIGEAMGGLRYLTNHAPGTTDLPPVRVGVSIGDSIAGLYAAFGIVAALWQRDAGDGHARTVDVALTEAVLSMMEGMLPEYGMLGKIKEPMGGGIATAAPTNAYPTRDGGWVLIGANSEPLFARLSGLMGRPELPGLAIYRDNPARVANSETLDAAIGDWTRQFDADDLVSMLNEADIPNARAYTSRDCVDDPQFQFRQMVREVDDPHFDKPVLHAGVVPHVRETPGGVRWPGPDIGQHGDEILSELLTMERNEIERLRAEGALA